MRFLFLFLILSFLAAELLPSNPKIEWGFLPHRIKEGKEEANIFYTAYFQPSNNQKPRPITFCLNGGPGASSVWLHLGGVGPLRLKDAYEVLKNATDNEAPSFHSLTLSFLIRSRQVLVKQP